MKLSPALLFLLALVACESEPELQFPRIQDLELPAHVQFGAVTGTDSSGRPATWATFTNTASAPDSLWLQDCEFAVRLYDGQRAIWQNVTPRTDCLDTVRVWVLEPAVPVHVRLTGYPLTAWNPPPVGTHAVRVFARDADSLLERAAGQVTIAP